MTSIVLWSKLKIWNYSPTRNNTKTAPSTLPFHLHTGYPSHKKHHTFMGSVYLHSVL